jgi:hypothetical protein
MWPTIDRARRRLSGSIDPAGTDASASEPTTPSTRRLEDVVIVLGRVELVQLRAALQEVLGDAVERPDSPARIERALSLLMAQRGAPGRPRVLRRPAAVSTPEAWEIHLDGVDRTTADAVRGAGRTGRFAP